MRSPLKLFPFFSSPLPSSSLTWVFVPCHALMGSSAAVAAYHPSLGFLHLPQSVFTLPFTLPLSVHFSRRSSFFPLLLLLFSSMSPHHLHAPPPTPATTTRPRLWFKHDGHPFEAQGRPPPPPHHPSSSVESCALDQFNQHREGDVVSPPPTPPPPQPRGFYVSI